MARRIELVRQAETTECGLAALAMVARYHGHNVDLAWLRRTHGARHSQPTLASILAIADALGLEARPLRVELDELAQLERPAILHWEFKHFVVLRPGDGASAAASQSCRGGVYRCGGRILPARRFRPG